MTLQNDQSAVPGSSAGADSSKAGAWTHVSTPPVRAGYYIVGRDTTGLPALGEGAAGYVGYARYLPILKQWRFSNAQQAFALTHWMPLPKPPNRTASTLREIV